MRRQDLIRMCLQNLRRRKSRTLLTVLGVLIGCCSIVIMVSIGIGMKESQDKMLSEMGDLTIITVYRPSGGKQGKKLNAAAVKEIAAMQDVDAATPRVSADEITVKLYAGSDRRYVCDYTSAAGLALNAMPGLGYTLLDGDYIPERPQNADDSQSAALAGQYLAYAFRDTMRPSGADMVDLYSMYHADGTVGEPPDAYFDIMKTPLVMELSTDDKIPPVKVELTIAGRVKEDYSKGYETSMGVLMDSKTLQTLLNKAKQAAGRPVDPNAAYQTVLVKVTSIDKVADVEQSIKKLGFQTSSMESIRKPMEKEARQKQLMLGGLGAVSLFVAALGITNTMIMSISERTREIGVMKALGCYVRDIRVMFLMEAGAIGLLGGIVGSVISLLASAVMNLAAGAGSIASPQDALLVLTTPGGRLSVVPPWLVAFAVAFSILIGLGSGYYPANKAVKIPALEAIKSE